MPAQCIETKVIQSTAGAWKFAVIIDGEEVCGGAGFVSSEDAQDEADGLASQYLESAEQTPRAVQTPAPLPRTPIADRAEALFASWYVLDEETRIEAVLILCAIACGHAEAGKPQTLDAVAKALDLSQTAAPAVG